MIVTFNCFFSVFSEDSSFQKSELVQSSMTTTVVTRTIVQESSTEGTTVVRSETTTVQSSSSEAGAASGDVAQGELKLVAKFTQSSMLGR